eukprot:Gb_35990 [translate_table: standard]
MEPKNGTSAYEEARKQRLEENRRRMEELNLPALSHSFSQNCNSASKPAQRQFKPRTPRAEGGPVHVRRSSRVASIPAPDYREVTVEIPGLRRSYGQRSLLPRIYASDEARSEAAEKALQIEKNLGSAHPSFVKPMLQSHVSGGFWLGLPSFFCSTNLPKTDQRMILEDENGDESETLFLSGKTGLSAGWRGFSIDHHLADGDCLVFQLVEPKRFKVYIVRAASFESATTSEELPSKNDVSQDGSDEADTELLAKETSNRKGRKRSSTAENETPKLKAKDAKVSKKQKIDNAKHEGKDDKVSKKSGVADKAVGEDERQEKATAESKIPVTTDARKSLRPKRSNAQAIEEAKCIMVGRAGSRRNQKLTNMLPSRKTGIHAHLKQAKATMVLVEV